MTSEPEPLDDVILDQLLHLPLAGAQLRMAAMQVRVAIGPALLAAEQRGRESAAALLDDMAREADAQAAVSLQLPKRANIQAKANALRAGAAAIRKGDAT